MSRSGVPERSPSFQLTLKRRNRLDASRTTAKGSVPKNKRKRSRYRFHKMRAAPIRVALITPMKKNCLSLRMEGGNGGRVRLSKLELQGLADELWHPDSCLSFSAGNQQMEQEFNYPAASCVAYWEKNTLYDKPHRSPWSKPQGIILIEYRLVFLYHYELARPP